MKKLSKALILLLVLCQLICCLAGCSKDGESGGNGLGGSASGNGGSKDTSEAADFVLTAQALSSYTVVYPQDSELEPAARTIATMLKELTGKEPEIKTDSASETEYEILIGLTEREATKSFYLSVEQYDSGFALVGKKILILGYLKETTVDSALMFKLNVIDRKSEDGVIMTQEDSVINKDSKRNAVYNWIQRSKEEHYASVLEGITVNALGDSYFAGDGIEKGEVWLSLLGSKYNMSMNNYGKGGSTVSNKVTTNSPMCERYTSMSNNNADIILLEGGRNDFNKDVSIGEIDGYDTTTFAGALNVIIEGLKEKYPNAMIVCISNWNFPDEKFGRVYTDYAGAMEAVAERQGVYYIPACDPAVSGINMASKSFRELYCIKTGDVSHLNFAGMKVAMTHFEKILAEYYQDFLSKK